MLLLRYSWLVLPLVLLVGCQSNQPKPTEHYAKTQLRAVLTQENGQWFATSCTDNSKQRFQLIDEANFSMDASGQLPKAKGSLFIDAEGYISNAPVAGGAGSFTVKQVNRLTLDADKGCKEDDFNKVIVRSIGKNPLWVTSIAPKGLVLERVGQKPLILPYVEENLPDGQMNFATDANGQHIELWVAPERCVDEQTEDVYAMTARLTINFQTFRGCAYLGPASGKL